MTAFSHYVNILFSKEVMETIPQGKGDPGTGMDRVRSIQVRLPERLARRAKAAAAENGSTLQQLVQAAIEQYLGMGKAA